MAGYGGAGLPKVVAAWDLFNQGADIPSGQLLYTVPRTGNYQLWVNAVLTTPDGVSSTVPNLRWNWTDGDASQNNNGTLANSSSTNALGQFVTPGTFYSYMFNAKGGTTISPFTAGYASGTPGAMKFAYHARLIFHG